MKCSITPNYNRNIIITAGATLLQKLADIWAQFYTSILPSLQAIFYPVQVRANIENDSFSLLSLPASPPPVPLSSLSFSLIPSLPSSQLENLTIRSLSLLTFRDVVLLKTNIESMLNSLYIYIIYIYEWTHLYIRSLIFSFLPPSLLLYHHG